MWASVLALASVLAVSAGIQPEIVITNTLATPKDGSLTVNVVKVPLPMGTLGQAAFISACGIYELRPVCAGGHACPYADDNCLALASELEHCDDPFGGLKKSTRDFASTSELEQYHDPIGPHTCGYIAHGQGYEGGFCSVAAKVPGAQRYTLCAGAASNAALKLKADVVHEKIQVLTPKLLKLQADILDNQAKLRQQAATIAKDMESINGPTEQKLHGLEGRTDALAKDTDTMKQSFLAEAAALDKELQQSEDLTAHLSSTVSRVTSQQQEAAALKATMAEQMQQMIAQDAFVDIMIQGFNATGDKAYNDLSKLRKDAADAKDVMGSKGNKETLDIGAQAEADRKAINAEVLTEETKLKSIADSDLFLQRAGFVAFSCLLVTVASLAFWLNHVGRASARDYNVLSA